MHLLANKQIAKKQAVEKPVVAVNENMVCSFYAACGSCHGASLLHVDAA